MELELHKGCFLENSKMAFSNVRKIGTKNSDVKNYGIY
jgi:hypothetical protein